MIAVLLAALACTFLAYGERRRRMAVYQQTLAAYNQAVAELEMSEAEVALATADQKRAEDRVAWSAEMLKKGSLSQAQHLSALSMLERAKFAVAQAQTKRKVLGSYRKSSLSEMRRRLDDARGALHGVGGVP
jgi:hypothetical protein